MNTNALEIKAGDILILDTPNSDRALVREAKVSGEQIHLKLRPEVEGGCPPEITLDNNDHVDIAERAVSVGGCVRDGQGRPDRPRLEWVRGKCPDCGDLVVSNCYYVGNASYIICWECWSSLGPKPTCSYRHVL